MSTPEQPGGTTGGSSDPTGAAGGRDRQSASLGGYSIGSRGDLARMPNFGNAEFVVLVLASIVLGLLAWVADGIRDTAWFTSFTAIVVAYLVSRGIAKASRVLEH